jgi:hypothetical protein
MQRSGSTFSFNVVKAILQRRGGIRHAVSSSIFDELNIDALCCHLILKSHDFDASAINLAAYGALRIICTVRRPEDAVASAMLIFGFSETDAISMIRSWLRFYQRVQKYALTIDYDMIDRSPVVAARMIGRHLLGNFGWLESRKIAHRYSKSNIKVETDHLDRLAPTVTDAGFSWYDSTTLFHRRHISSLKSQSAEERLPSDQVRRIREALAQPV